MSSGLRLPWPGRTGNAKVDFPKGPQWFRNLTRFRFERIDGTPAILSVSLLNFKGPQKARRNLYPKTALSKSVEFQLRPICLDTIVAEPCLPTPGITAIQWVLTTSESRAVWPECSFGRVRRWSYPRARSHVPPRFADGPEGGLYDRQSTVLRVGFESQLRRYALEAFGKRKLD